MILMKYHALFFIFEKAAKFEVVVCCKLLVALYGVILFRLETSTQGYPQTLSALFAMIKSIFRETNTVTILSGNYKL